MSYRNFHAPRVAVLILCCIAVHSNQTGVMAQDQDNQLRLVSQVGHASNGVLAVAISPAEGRLSVTGGEDHSAILWHTTTGREIRSFEGHRDRVKAVAFSPDACLLLTGSADGTSRLWDISTGRELRRFNADRQIVESVAFSPDGRILAIAAGTDVRLFYTKTGKMYNRFQTDTDNKHSWLYSLEFSRDGEFVLTAGYNSIPRIWRISTGKEYLRFTGHSSGYVSSVMFSPKGDFVLTGSSDGTARLWDMSIGKEVRRFEHGGRVLAVSFSPDGGSVFTGGDADNFKGRAVLWDVATGDRRRVFEGHFGAVTSMSVSPDGRFLLTGSYDWTARLWEVSSGVELALLASRSYSVNVIATSADGRFVIAGTDGGVAHLWNIAAGIQSHELLGYASGAAFSPNGRYVLTGSTDSTAYLWDIKSGDIVRKFEGHKSRVVSVAFSPDGRFGLTGSKDATARLWDIASGEMVRLFQGHKYGVLSVAFSKDGSLVVTGSDGNSSWKTNVCLWDVASGAKLRDFEGFGRVEAVDFSPNGAFLLAAGGREGGTLLLWETATGELVWDASAVSEQPFGRFDDAAFSPDGRFVLAGSIDGYGYIFDSNTGKELRRLGGHSAGIFGGVMAVAFDAAGHHLLTGGREGSVLLRAADSDKEICRMISFMDGTWAVIDPEGRYDASNGGNVEGLHWVFDQEPIALSQLKERYYEPGLLAKIMGFNDECLRDVKAFFDPELYPEIELTAPEPDNPDLKISLTNRGGGIGRVVVFINGKEIAADARDPRDTPGASELQLQIDISSHPYLVPGQENTIEVKAFNAEGYLSSRNVKVIYKAPEPNKIELPTLWSLIVGVSDYHGDDIDLCFAAKDAVDMEHALKIGAQRLFGVEHVQSRLLTTEKDSAAIYPSKENMQKGFKEIAAKAKSTDILVVYLAGHGVNYGGQDGDYYYLTAEARGGDLKDPAVRETAALSSAELTELIKKVPALKQVLILDTCASGRLIQNLTDKRITPSSQKRAIERMKDRIGMYVLAGSAADAVSYEASCYGQGLLTYSLLLGMRGAALRENQFIDVGKLFEFSADQVPMLAKNIGGIQHPIIAIPHGGASFDIGWLKSEDRPHIPLATIKPLVLRANFQNAEPPFSDNLNIERLINEALRDLSARGRTAPLVFVDTVEFPGAYSIAGRYQVVDGQVTVAVYLLQGLKTIGQFTVHGESAGLKQLTTDILNEVQKQFNITRE